MSTEPSRTSTASTTVLQSTAPAGQAIDPRAYVADGVQIGQGVTIGPMAAVLADACGTGSPAILADGVWVGANATILPGCTIGARARIMPGAVVTRDVPDLAIVAGNPARITGYVSTERHDAQVSVQRVPRGKRGTVTATSVRGVTLHELSVVEDLRGSLSPGEFERDIPFAAKRYFLVYDVPTSETRGEHAHIACKQFLVAVRGSVHVVADDGVHREEFVLDRPGLGLYLPPMTWGVQYRYQPETMLMVFASHYYCADDYIRNYQDFSSRCAQAAQAPHPAP